MNNRQVLESMDFGERVAEQEGDRLARYFVDTDHWKNVFSGSKDIVYGPKGSGKSAIYLLLQESAGDLFDRSVIFVPAENIRGATAFREIVADPPLSETEFIRLWKLYLLSLIGNTFVEYAITGSDAALVTESLAAAGLLEKKSTLGQRLVRALAYVRSWMKVDGVEGTLHLDPISQLPVGVSGKIIFGTPAPQQAKAGVISIDRLFDAANAALEQAQYSIWLGIDRLDVAFADNDELEANSLRALFKTYLDLQGASCIALKIFLRSDIWKRITGSGFREASHITRSLTISWSSDTLLNLVLRRMLQSDMFVAAYAIDRRDVLADINRQKEVFYRAFPRQVDIGEKKPVTFDWMLSRTRDGTEFTAPRELIHLLTSMTELQLQKMAIGAEELSGEDLYSRQVIKEALRPVSKTRLEQTLYAEYPMMPRP